MRKIEKGFTIIEVLAVIVVMTLLTVLIVPNIINVTSNKRAEVSEASKQIIYDATDIYVKENKTTYPIATGATYCIKLEDLVKNGNLVAPIKDLKSDKEIPLNYHVRVTLDSYEQYNYELVKTCTYEKGVINDNTPPIIANVALKTKTSNSITVVANGYDGESTIEYYQFSKDNGVTWEPSTPQQSNEYTFSNLTTGTYQIKSRVINATYETKGLTDNNYKDSNKNEISTGIINTPTYTINKTGWQTSKIVTINFNDPENKYTHSYQKDGGEWTEVNENSQAVTFTANGTVVARVTDGTNIVTGSSCEVSEIDTTGPTISSVTPSTVWDYRNSVTFTATDSGSKISGYNVTETDSAPSSWIPVTSFVEEATETKYAYNAAWARVLHQNSQGGYTVFADETEALSANSTYKYSVLGSLNNYKNSANKWEFLLEYPDYSASEYNRWKQSLNPATTSEPSGDGSEYATGYEAVHIDWDTNYWGGLGKSTSNTWTLIDGSYGHGNWFFAVASYQKYQRGLPCGNSTSTSIVNLWARIDDKTSTTKTSLTAKVGDLKSNKTYYLWVKDSSGNTQKQSFTTNKVDSAVPAAPGVSGGSTTWMYGSRAFTLTAPSTSSGIKTYEYYTSNSSTTPGNVSVSGSTTSTSVSISKPGKYIFFRAVSNSGVVGDWTAAKNLYVYDSTSFTATSSPYTYTVPTTGKYKIELWGAQGYKSYGGAGGKGGYVSGIINLTKNTNLYFYVGNQGNYTTSAWNGAGVCHKNSGNYCGSSGGGGVDVRTVKGSSWNEAASLRSRIMVAGSGGGAGGSSASTTYYSTPGVGGGLSAGSSAAYSSTYTAATGGNQTAGGYSTHSNANNISDSYGTFGMGPYTDNNVCCGASGGSGWYGGGGGCGNSAGGGSAYISGHTGCVAVTSTSSSSPKSGCVTGSTNNSCSVSPYGYTFTSTKIIDGAGYNWTTTKGSYVGQPQPDGTTAAGHSGGGYARITYIVD